MPHNFLHNHKDFPEFLRIVRRDTGIPETLIEKDYWIMHCLYGLQQLGFKFELKGGTSLSKGFQIINRFSEDIDIRIEPPENMDVKTGRNQDKPQHIESRKQFYDWLASTITINGIKAVERDEEFDDHRLRSAGIRLRYEELTGKQIGLKDGILLEVGFDNVTPNIAVDISSWLYDFAAGKVEVTDNRAHGVLCYDPGYTLVEKLQAISKKYRQQKQSGKFPPNFLRHYYDVYCLLADPGVNKFIGTDAYKAHKKIRFYSDQPPVAEDDAFRLSKPHTYKLYEAVYDSNYPLYYKDRPTFSEIMDRIKENVDRL